MAESRGWRSRGGLACWSSSRTRQVVMVGRSRVLGAHLSCPLGQMESDLGSLKPWAHLGNRWWRCRKSKRNLPTEKASFSWVWSLHQVPSKELGEAMVGSWWRSPVPATLCVAASSTLAALGKSNGIDWSNAGNTVSQSTRDQINQLITSYEVYTRQPDGQWRYPFSSPSTSRLRT